MSNNAQVIERFAPSPTGRLHLGHAYSAWLSYTAAMQTGGQWLLRIENIDQTRSRDEFTADIYDDLLWLGMDWPRPVMVQSKRLGAYDEALVRLRGMGVIYGCKCTRGDIKAVLGAPNEGDTAPAYPGTCRELGLLGDELAWRLDIHRAFEMVGAVFYREIGQDRDEIIHVCRDQIEAIGDVILARRDLGTSYHIAVVVDDAAQSVTHVTRGADIEDQTAIHVILQKLLRFETPIYRHHALIRDEGGKRLAKRSPSHEIHKYREAGVYPKELFDKIHQGLYF